jgi:hypothetical protein
MVAANAGERVGSGEYISMQGAISELLDKPAALSLQDEFGSFLNRINGKKASSFEAQLTKIMRELWGLSFKSYNTPISAARKGSVVYAPALSIYGLTTHEQFYESLKSGDLPNGFLNRWFVLSSDTRAKARMPDESSRPVPGVRHG